MSSLIGTLFKSTTGLNAYTQGLDNLSTNVANLNTPGYKGKELQFRELADQNPSGKSPNDQHQGVEVTGASYRFIQGDTTETGNATDLAINGKGFFVLNNRSDTHQSAERKGAAISELFFTRAGQFQFDDDGFLIDPSSGLQVNALNEEGELEAININELNISLPEPTKIRFSGNLNSNTATGGTFPDNESDTALTTVIDSAGREQNIEILFTKEVGNHWRVGITHEEGDLLTREQPLSFRGDGSPILDGPFSLAFNPMRWPTLISLQRPSITSLSQALY